MGKRLFLNGDEAAAWGVRLSRAQVISAYPITPQTITVEKLAEFAANREMNCEYCYVESEHSALATAMGASMTGARAFTATSSQGLLYMCEMLHYVSGSRLPVVMMNACRSVAAPWNINGDHRDSLSQRDSGWVQIYVENGQEALDMMLQAYRLAEHPEVYLPVMVCLDGFINTHTYEMVEVPEQADADRFLPPFRSKNAIDFSAPRAFCMTASTEWNTEFRIQQQRATEACGQLIGEIDREFCTVMGRKWGGMIEEYRMEDARVCLVGMGSLCGTAREVVDELRAKGVPVGFVKLRMYRPFPTEYFRKLAGVVEAVGVIDRDISFGFEGALGTEVRAAMSLAGAVPPTVNFIAGLGGRDVSADTIRQMYDRLMRAAAGEPVETMEFIDARWQDHAGKKSD